MNIKGRPIITWTKDDNIYKIDIPEIEYREVYGHKYFDDFIVYGWFYNETWLYIGSTCDIKSRTSQHLHQKGASTLFNQYLEDNNIDIELLMF